MANVYDEFRKEFDRMPRDEQVQLGMAGLIQMYSDDSTGAGKMSRNMPSRSRGRSSDSVSVSGIGDTVKVHVESIDERSMDTLVSKMRKETFSVRIAHVFNDLIDPLAYRMNSNMIKNQIFMNRIQYENVLYYRGIIEAVNNLGGSNRENFFEAVSRQYQNFMRHPIWNSMRLLSSTILAPMAKLTTGLLFGFKEQKSDTDRIVEAINQQTEFQRTGKIDRETNVLTRMFRTGLVNSTGRLLTTALTKGNLGIDRAKDAERKRSEGQQLNFFDKASKRLFGGYTNILGDEMARNRELDYQNNVIENQKEMISILQSLFQPIYAGYVQDTVYQQTQLNIISQLAITMSNIDTMLTYTMSGMSDMFQGMNMGLMGGEYAYASISSPEQKQRARREEDNHRNTIIQTDLFEDIADSTKSTDKAVEKIRRVQLSERIANWFRSGVGLLGSASGVLAGAIAGKLLKGGFLPVSVGLFAGTAANSLAQGFMESTGLGNWLKSKGFVGSDQDFYVPTPQELVRREVVPAMMRTYENLVNGTNVEIKSATQTDMSSGGMTSPEAFQRALIENRNRTNNGSPSSLIKFLMEKEGFSSTAYPDGFDSDGNQLYSIGFGNQMVNGKRVQAGQTITRRQAEDVLHREAMDRRSKISNGVGANLTEGQLNALTSLAYNVGTGSVLNSTLVRKLEGGDIQGAASEFSRWNIANGEVHPALVTRRAEERNMFLGNTRPASSKAGPRITDGAMSSAVSVSSGAGASDWGAVVAQKLDAVVAGIREMVLNQEESTGSLADSGAVNNFMGR